MTTPATTDASTFLSPLADSSSITASADTPTTFPATPLNQVRRRAQRGQYDKETVYRILDEALICHVGFVEDGQPFVLPTLHARQGDTIYLHGAVSNRMLAIAGAGQPVCIEATLVDGLVLARSVFHHSMNYRSVAVFGRGRVVDDAQEKLAAMAALTEHVMPGRWDDARQPNRAELDGTIIVAVDVDTASAKIRGGPPIDDAEDMDRDTWAGILPLAEQAGVPERDALQTEPVPLPDYIRDFRREREEA